MRGISLEKYIDSLNLTREEKSKLFRLIKMELGSRKNLGIQDSFTVSKGSCPTCGRKI